MSKQQVILLHGTDTYRSYHALKAIEKRFLSQPNSMIDCATYDMMQTPLETVKQTFLATPFLVTHRLFILKHVFTAPKATIDEIAALLQSLTSSTVVILYEGKNCDQRLSLYKWLANNAKIQEFSIPDERGLATWVNGYVNEHTMTITPEARDLLINQTIDNTWALAQELNKLIAFAQSQNQTSITKDAIEQLCVRSSDQSQFALTNAFRDGDLKQTFRVYKDLSRQEDPFFLAATLTNHIRSVVKIYLCLQRGITQSVAIAKASGLNPYVVKLLLPSVNQLNKSQIHRSYHALVQFDSRVKDGSVPAETGLLLMITRLHGTLNTRPR